MSNIDDKQREAIECLYLVLCEKLKIMAGNLSVPNQTYKSDPAQWNKLISELFDIKQVVNAIFIVKEL